MPQNWKFSRMIALISLVIITAIWGWSFVIVKNVIARMPVMDFLAVRFIGAAIVMVFLRPTCLRNMTRRGLRRGIGLGIVLGLGFITQTYGLLSTSATVSGFITGTFVVFTPIMSWILLRHKISRGTWLAVALASIGLALLSLYDLSVGFGELLTLGCALFFAIHIVGLSEWSPQHETYGFALIQIATVAIISIVAATHDGITMPLDIEVWKAVGITAVLATAVAFIVQTWAQSLVSPTHAAVSMTMEPVFAGIFAVLIGGELLTLRAIGGAACILAAMLAVQLKSVLKSTQQEGSTINE